MKEKFESSQFFKSHEIIGSSILVMHDHTHKVNAWMIDFAKTLQVSDDLCPLSHSIPWVVGNHEDGYVTGLTNLIEVISEIRCEEREHCERDFERHLSKSDQRDSKDSEKT
jgi:1D-myo-inositol-triphosphate 3-kinase